MPGGIFVSYRREDTRHAAGRLADRLLQTYTRDQLFMDVDNIEPGLDFTKVLRDKVQACDVLLAIIGPGWLNARDAVGERRLDQPKDFVRIEIEAALARDVRVVPVLVDGANMPAEQDLPEKLRPLVNRHAVRLSHERFGADAELLAKSLERVVPPAPRGWMSGFKSRSSFSTPAARPASYPVGVTPPAPSPLAQTMAIQRSGAAPGMFPVTWDAQNIVAYSALAAFLSLYWYFARTAMMKQDFTAFYLALAGVVLATLRGRALTGLESTIYWLALVIAPLLAGARDISNLPQDQVLIFWATAFAVSLVCSVCIGWARSDRLTGLEVASQWLVATFTFMALMAVLAHQFELGFGEKPAFTGLVAGAFLSGLTGLWLRQRWKRRTNSPSD